MTAPTVDAVPGSVAEIPPELRWDRLIDRGAWAEDRVLRRHHFPIGPRNALSNLGYWVAAIILVIARPAGMASLVLAAALGLLGLGSGLYHCYKRGWANALDWAGMFAALGATAAFGVIPESTIAPAVMAGFSAAAIAVFVYWLKLKVDALMGVFLIFGVLRPLVFGTGRGFVVLGLLVFVVSYAAWFLDRMAGDKGVRAKWVGLWGHAIWHLGTALAFLLVHWGQLRAIGLVPGWP